MNFITLQTDDGFSLPALHMPSAQGQGTPMVLIQEIFGINDAMRAAAQAWAQDGFEVLCPDLFARQEAGVVLEPRVPEQFQRGVALMQGMDPERAVKDLNVARQWFVDQGRGDKVTALGYCLGGRLAVMMALSTPISATVSYYGVGLEDLLPAERINMAPCLLHIAERDTFVPPPARQTILERAALQANMPAYVYEGCDHAFARPDGEHFDAQAADLARQRTLDFLRG
ncbi:dienelactone hydrolase family protein [Comamonadaceae bacterium OH2310_COT-174]|uniref:Carboxymethylenebutenolidase n=1 Tax=Vandammella animalimorsus TaxID=2029117 RepID=A0A2A2A7D8_9BURK|nr:dienelactone hydrolase family protein [Vandammella animalimorsus]PAT34415.1 carboxymethylenebutenolidase [Vandammella animalimorsus]RRD67966.1 dienelactone hydrolase family protein [Comamonadaceae bacterium OH2310_COT-174]